MSPDSRINCICKALLITPVFAALIVGVWPQLAHADWRSLSGGLLPAHVSGVSYKISPDSRTVAFVADKDTDDVNELYAVPITGTTPIKLNPPLVNNGDVKSFQFTTDGQHVIYLADQEADERVEMFRVPVGGGLSIKLNPPLVAGGNVSSFKIDPDSGRVVYVADQETNEVFELWSISGTGGGLFKLSGAMVSGGDVGIFEIDRLSDRAVFSADREIDGTYELYSTPLLGGSPLKLNPPIQLQGGGDAGLYSEFAVNPIIPVVVFNARTATHPRGKVYSIATAGDSLNELSFNMLTTQRILSFRISPAGDRVVFNVATSNDVPNKGFAFKGNLYSALIGGGGAANVTETADPYYGTDDYNILPDGSRVVYRFQTNAASPVRLESATMLGVRAPLYVPGASDPPLSFYRLSANSQWVMYQTGTSSESSRVHTIPPGGGGPTNHGSAQFALMLPDSSRIAYTRIVSAAIGATDLFSAQIFGGDERNLSGMNGTGYVGDAQASADNKWIAFVVQINSQYDLRVSDGNTAQPPATPITYYVYLPIIIKQS